VSTPSDEVALVDSLVERDFGPDPDLEVTALAPAAADPAVPAGVTTSNIPGVFALADMLFTRARAFVPKGIRDPAELVAVILTGQEMGMGAMTSMRTLYIVNGKVSLSSEGMLAFALKAGVKATWVKTTNKVATIKLEREGFAPFTLSFTWEDATTARLTGKGVWKSYPATMLRNRAVSAAIKAYCPDVLLGAYVPEEMSSMGYATSWESAAVDSEYEDDAEDVEEL